MKGPDTGSTDYDLNRLRWQCRRGMLELDYLLSDFVERGFDALSASEKADFVRLLGEADQDLQRWLVGGHPVPDEGYRTLVHRIIDRPQSSLPDS